MQKQNKAWDKFLCFASVKWGFSGKRESRNTLPDIVSVGKEECNSNSILGNQKTN